MKVPINKSLMDVLILGCGNIGAAAAEDLAKSAFSAEVVLADKDEAKAKKVAEKIGRSNVSWIRLDASKRNELVNALGKFDLILGFLPGNLGYSLIEACIKAEKDLVDVSYTSQDPLRLNEEAVKADVTIVPDCGLAPGISNIIVGYAAKKLDNVQKIHIMVGGLPEKPIPPIDYIITWSPESLIDEYTRKARIVIKGKTVEVEALSGIEEVNFPGVGKLEAFYTDGLRSLLKTFSGVDEMWEKTLRYKGHAKKIELLKALGFFEDEEVDVDGVKISPKRFTARLFLKKLWKPNVKDVVALKVEVLGLRAEKKIQHVYRLLDFYDVKSGTTAMARTTAYPASIVAQMLLKGAVKAKGVVPPEKLGMGATFFTSFLRELEKRGIKIIEEEVTV
ncbi:MAG: saccharopine dehydrogenase C-terminal domain-containing protein [Candidatus Bathyarchaeia archaeon]